MCNFIFGNRAYSVNFSGLAVRLFRTRAYMNQKNSHSNEGKEKDLSFKHVVLYTCDNVYAPVLSSPWLKENYPEQGRGRGTPTKISTRHYYIALFSVSVTGKTKRKMSYNLLEVCVFTV